MLTGVDMVHVHYRGDGAGDHRSDRRPGPGDVRRCRVVDFIHQSRQVRALAVTTAARSGRAAGRPDRGRIRAGLRGERLARASARRADTPAAIVDKLNKEVNAALADPRISEASLVNLGGQVFAGSPADFGKFLESETDKWGKVVRAANVKAE